MHLNCCHLAVENCVEMLRMVVAVPALETASHSTRVEHCSELGACSIALHLQGDDDDEGDDDENVDEDDDDGGDGDAKRMLPHQWNSNHFRWHPF